MPRGPKCERRPADVIGAAINGRRCFSRRNSGRYVPLPPEEGKRFVLRPAWHGLRNLAIATMLNVAKAR
jgi:hypothetical protein